MELLIATHEGLASGLLSAHDMLAGKNDQIATIELDDRGIRNFRERFAEIMKRYEPGRVLILTDLKNGTPHLVAKEYEKANPERVRQVKTTPIIMMTARDSVIDRVSGLDHGADDYIVKPFAIEELLARLRAVLRRVKIEKDASKVTVAKQKIVKFKDLTIETANRIVHRGDGKAIDLTKREYNLLMTLIENKNNVVSRDQLLNKIWGPESNIETNVVEVYVRYLRNKIDAPGQPSYIKTVRGTGYMVRDEDDDQE